MDGVSGEAMLKRLLSLRQATEVENRRLTYAAMQIRMPRVARGTTGVARSPCLGCMGIF